MKKDEFVFIICEGKRKNRSGNDEDCKKSLYAGYVKDLPDNIICPVCGNELINIFDKVCN